MRTVALIGYSALGQQIHNLLLEAGKPDKVLFFDDHHYKSGAENSFPFDGCLESRFADCEFYVCLGYHHLLSKAKLSRLLLAENRRLPSFVHPTCFVGRGSKIGDGSVVYPMCNIDAECDIGVGVVINNSVVVSHTCSLGDASYLSPGVVLSGGVKVGECTFLGSGATVANGLCIGAATQIGIGSVVTKDVPKGISVIGNPMRVLGSPLQIN